MKKCSRETGRRLLRGELTLDGEADFTEHLESCLTCLEWLEEDSSDSEMRRFARELSVTDGNAEQACEDVVDEALPALWPFLSPSDDPSMLGRLGAYEIVGVVGRGGTGIVLKGVDGPLNRHVAIKVLDPALANSGSARQRFLREAKAMAAVTHEHVVPIYAVNEYQGFPCFTMEYVPDGTLEKRIGDEGPLNVVSVVRIAVQIAEALAAAHSQGVVHRDIKPANILLDRGTDRVRVADFGLARVAADAGNTRSGVIAGTPQYMSPEQVKGSTCDARSDLFSLGSVMYAMCVGHSPFRCESVYGIMQRVVSDDPRGIREQNSNVPEWLEQLISRLLSKDIERRFDSAESVAVILRRELAHLQNPTDVRLPKRNWARRIEQKKTLRSVPGWLIMCGMLAILVVGFAFSPFFHRTSTPTREPSVTERNTSPRVTKPEHDGYMAGQWSHLWHEGELSLIDEQLRTLQRSIHDHPVEDAWENKLISLRKRILDLQQQQPFQEIEK